MLEKEIRIELKNKELYIHIYKTYNIIFIDKKLKKGHLLNPREDIIIFQIKLRFKKK